MPQVKYVHRSEMPASAIRAHGAMREAIDNLARARRTGQVLRLEFGPDERSYTFISRYRNAAKKLGVGVRIVAEWRPYRTPNGKKGSEPGMLYVEIQEPTADQLSTPKAVQSNVPPASLNGWDAGRPTQAEPETDPAPRMVLPSELATVVSSSMEEMK